MATNIPNYPSVVFARTVRVRREHIANDQVSESGELMRVVYKGETKSILKNIANELVIAESAVFENGANRERIDAIKAEARAEQEAATAKPKLQKAA